MEDIIDIIVTETTNLIEITSQPTDEIIDVNIIDNREDITLNVTPTLVEININSLTGNFGVNWGDIEGTLSNQTDLQNTLNLKADLVDGKVPSSQLPSYVDDVVEVANYASLPVTGEVGKIYITLDTNFIYRWAGSTYVEIKDSSAVWGAITGTLSNQTDLQNALNAKVPYTGATGNVNLGEYGATVGYLGFDLTPTGTPTGVGTMSWDSANRTLQLVDGDGDTTLQLGQEERVLVHNNTGATLTDGQVVYVTGSTGELPLVALASNTAEATSSVTFGVVTESIAHGADGFITTSGIVHGLNTLAFTEGNAIWLGATAGTFTETKPTAPANSVLVGYVIKKAGGNGSIFVKIQNGSELDELHDVLITSKANSEGLFYDSASGLWKNKSIATVLGYTPEQPLTFASPLIRTTNAISIQVANSTQNGYLSSTDWNTFNNKQVALSGTGFVKISGTTISYDNSDYLPTTLTTTAKTVLLNGQQFSIYGNPGGVFTSGRIIVDDLFGAVGYQVSGVFYGLKIDTSGNAYFDNSGTTRFYNSVRFDSTLTNGTYTYTLPGATGTLALTSDLSSLISGSGTSGIVPKFTGTGSIGNSQIYDNGTRVSIGADVTTTNRFTAVSSTTSAYAIVAQASSAAHGIWSNVLGTGEIFRGQTAGGSYFIINNGGNAFLNGNLNVGDFASTSYRLNVVGTANLTGALSGTSATFSGQTRIETDGSTPQFFIKETDVTGQGSTAYFQLSNNTIYIGNGNASYGTLSDKLTIASSGAATFSSSVTAGGVINANQSIILGGTTNNINSDNSLLLYSGNNNVYLQGSGGLQLFESSARNNGIGIQSNISFFLSNSERMRITSGGLVGINTTTPFNFGSGSGMLDVRSQSVGAVSGIFVSNSDATARLTMYINNAATATIGTSTNHAVQFVTNDTERMRITSAGSVFIGKTTGSSKFGVSGLPTSSAGLSSGDFYQVAGAVMVVP